MTMKERVTMKELEESSLLEELGESPLLDELEESLEELSAFSKINPVKELLVHLLLFSIQDPDYSEKALKL